MRSNPLSTFSLPIVAGLCFVLIALSGNLQATNFKEHLEIGKDLFAKGDFDHAASEFQEAFRRKPNSAIAKSWLGLAYAHWGNSLGKTGETDRAIEIYKKAVDTLPDEPYWHAYLAAALEKKGDRDAATHEFRLAASLSPLDDGLKDKAADPACRMAEYRAENVYRGEWWRTHREGCSRC